MGAASSTVVGNLQDAPCGNGGRESNSVTDAADASECTTSSSGHERIRVPCDDEERPYGEFSPNKKATFDNLPDEVLIKILAAVSSAAEKPADVVAPSMTCRRWRRASCDREVRRRTSRGGVGVRARHWGEGAVWFLQRLCDAGCLEACFMLGMIFFYCIPGGQLDGGKLLLHSAKAGHAASLHSLGVMSFNGSGYSAQSKDFRSGLALCAKAAALGHAEAMREVGLCLLDGFGVKRSHVDGYRLLLKAHLAELGISDTVADPASGTRGSKRPLSNDDEHSGMKKRRMDVFGNSDSISIEQQERAVSRLLDFPSENMQTPGRQGAASPLGVVTSTVMKLVRAATPSTLSQLRPALQQLEAPLVDAPIHPAHTFIAEWFALADETAPEETVVELSGKGVASVRSASAGKCCRPGCGRREMRPLEFWRCASCWNARYCSRACQLQDWRKGHSAGCKPVANA